MPAKIKFGTSGWRAIIAEEFTFENLRLATEAIGRVVRRENAHPTLLVAHDTRFLSEEFADAVSRVLASQGIRVKLCNAAVPTPAVAVAIVSQKLDGALNMTASHNPGEYNGLKFSTPDGAPALPEVTSAIEKEIESLQASRWRFDGAANPSLIERVDIREDYLRDLTTKVDLERIRASGLRVGYDPLFGSGMGYLDELLRRNGIPVESIHSHRDVWFGGHHPEPSGDHLDDLRALMKEKDLRIGLATDGDADRFGVLDEDGTYIAPNELLGLLIDYLVESRGWREGVARTVATSHFVDRVARLHGLEVFPETPVGFKYIGEYIKAGKIILGGEESAGLSIKGHVPEKDGILACLLAAEMVAGRGKSLKSQLKGLFSRTGPVYNRRLNLRLTPELAALAKERVAEDVKSFDGRPVREQNRKDGLKLVLDEDSWVLIRLSGTEPVVRFYAEAASDAELEKLLAYGEKWIREG